MNEEDEDDDDRVVGAETDGCRGGRGRGPDDDEEGDDDEEELGLRAGGGGRVDVDDEVVKYVARGAAAEDDACEDADEANEVRCTDDELLAIIEVVTEAAAK